MLADIVHRCRLPGCHNNREFGCNLTLAHFCSVWKLIYPFSQSVNPVHYATISCSKLFVPSLYIVVFLENDLIINEERFIHKNGTVFCVMPRGLTRFMLHVFSVLAVYV